MKQKVLHLRKLRPYVAVVAVVFAMGLLIWAVANQAVATQVVAAQPSQSPDEGRRIFQQSCASCHTLGKGDLLGPDLAGVTDRRDPAWLQRWIREPDRVLAEKDPLATELLQKYKNIPMPNLRLTESEVTSLIAFLGAGEPAAAARPALYVPVLAAAFLALVALTFVGLRVARKRVEVRP